MQQKLDNLTQILAAVMKRNEQLWDIILTNLTPPHDGTGGRHAKKV